MHEQLRGVDEVVDDEEDGSRWRDLVRAAGAEERTAVVVNGARLSRLDSHRAAAVVESLGAAEVVVLVPDVAWAAQQRFQGRLLVGKAPQWERWLRRSSILAS